MLHAEQPPLLGNSIWFALKSRLVCPLEWVNLKRLVFFVFVFPNSCFPKEIIRL